jgi:large subunit ribosomal protein L21
MFAIIETCGKQYKVTEGARVRLDLMDTEIGGKVEFPQVLCLFDDDKIKVGQPNVPGALVTATVAAHGKDKKIIVFKYTRRKNTQRKMGHRQPFTEVIINGIKGL